MTNSTLAAVLHDLRRLAEPRDDRRQDDRQLLERFLTRREEDAFALLIRRHGRMVLSACRCVLSNEADVEDAFQATFLVLLRRASSMTWRASIGAWLFGVAHRVAVRARANIQRRQRRESEASRLRPELQPPPDLSWREAVGILHEELDRLSDRYRLPLLLCYFDGKTREEAATILACSAGAVKGRLECGREMLRTRLLRRGLTLSAALLTAASLAAQPASALPVGLMAKTMKAISATAAGKGLAGVVSASVAELVKGMTAAMVVSKAKAATALLLIVTLLAGAGAWTCRTLATPQPAEPQVGPAKPPLAATKDRQAPRQDKGKEVHVSGRVLDPDGKPVRGAKLLLLYYSKEIPHKVWAVSDREGRFQFAAPRELVGNSRSEIHIIAAADGFGFAAAKVGKGGVADLTLRLVKDDAPIRGRILDLQGRPVAGARVRIDNTVYVPEKGDLTAWLTALKAPNRDLNLTWGYRYLTGLRSPDFDLLFPSVTTGADGRFCLQGIGRERVAELRIEGPAIATQVIHAMTRPQEAIHLSRDRKHPRWRTISYYGADFDLVAAPSRPVVGAVRDKDSGKPLAGVKIESELVVNAGTSDLLRTVTDSEGRYRLVGLPKGDGIKIAATTDDFPTPPKNDMTTQPAYLSAVKTVGNPPGIEAVTLDFALKRGTWIKGRITDKSTGKSLGGHVEYFCFTDNPNAKELPPSLRFYLKRWTGEDGSFLIPALSGRGLIAVRANGDHYIMGAGAERIKERDPENQRGLFSTAPDFCYAGNHHALVEINPKPGDGAITCNIALDPGRSLKGTVFGPDGKLLAGARISGLKDMEFWANDPLPGAEFTVESLQPHKPRVLQFVHDNKKLAGVVVLRGDEKEPISVQLDPWGVLTGRLIPPRGESVAEMKVRCRVRVKRQGEDIPNDGLSAKVDKDGRFRIEGLAPGREYHDFTVTKGSYLRELAGGGPKTFTLKAGETKDLGDLQVKPME